MDLRRPVTGKHSQLPFNAYGGDASFVFASYSHEDTDLVYPELVAMCDEGFNVWYDEGITPGHEWTDEIAARIENCALFVVFVSPQSVASDNCRREINFALGRHKPVLAVHLEETALPAGLELSLGDRQAIIKPRLEASAYRAKLTQSIENHVTREGSPEPIAPPTTARRRLKGRWLFAAVAGLVAIAWGVVSYMDRARARDLADAQLAVAQRHVSEGNFVQALTALNGLGPELGDDPRHGELLERVSTVGTVLSDPAGLDVYVREYSRTDQWMYLGRTPIRDVPVPIGVLAVRLERGDVTRYLVAPNPSWAFNNADSEPVVLEFFDDVPEGQVLVPSFPGWIHFEGFGQQNHEVGRFLVDTYEVTNAEYRDFVDAGAYESERFWEGMTFLDDGNRLSWDQAIVRFVDSTGRPGPATWELGSYPVGRDDWPVSGISWYEAVAYARFRGRDLPTRYHWARAATDWGLGSALVEMANFGNEGVAPAGRYESLGPYGTYDMVGNVREWVWNASGTQRMILGGAWDTAPYMSNVAASLPPMDRSPSNGFRTVAYIDGPESEHLAAWTRTGRNIDEIRPLGDEAYATLISQYDYAPLSGIQGTVIESVENAHAGWRRETIHIDSAYAEEGFRVYVYFPIDAPPKVQAVIYFGGIGPFLADDASETRPILEAFYVRDLDVFIASGRALVWPVLHGSYERYRGVFGQLEGRRLAEEDRTQFLRWRSDVGEIVDYLATREEFDAGPSFLAYSYGGIVGTQLLALEPRLKAGVIIAGGVRSERIANPLTDAANYLPRVTQPTLVMSGRYDYTIPLDTQRKLFELLGSEVKKHFIYEGEHMIPSRRDLLLEAVPWLDEHVGPAM